MTAYFKAEDSLDPKIVALMRGWKARAKGEFVVESKQRPRVARQYAHYRTERILKSLAQWLRGQGIDSKKCQHTLRKEFGSLIASEHCIYAASRALRHADIQVTAMHYLDKKQRISVGLGKFLQPENLEEIKFTQKVSTLATASQSDSGSETATA